MEKLKSAFTASKASAKLSKVFGGGERGGMHNLRRSGTNLSLARDPFADGPDTETPQLPMTHLILHCVALLFCFLAICTMGAVAGFQAKWFSVSGGTGFVLFLLLLSFFISSFLIIVPIVYYKWDRFKRPAQFLNQTRTTFILHGFGTFLMLIAAFIVTISAFTAKGCKNADNDPHSSLGDDYKKGLAQWCRTKKASAFFDWFSFVGWAALLVLTALVFRKERRANHREQGFVPPGSDGISYSNILAADDERYGDKVEVGGRAEAAAGGVRAGAGVEGAGAGGHGRNDSMLQYEPSPSGAGYGYNPPAAAAVYQQQAQTRPSVDAYGAFDGDGMPKADEPSRTMQLAYTDPYAQIRQSLMSPAQGASHQHQQHQPQAYYQPTAYSPNTIPPGPPTYQGYRQH